MQNSKLINMNHRFTKVERAFIEHQEMGKNNAKIPYITVNNFPQLGLLTSLRFLEWVNDNPEGVINPKSIESVRRITRELLKTRHIVKAFPISRRYSK